MAAAPEAATRKPRKNIVGVVTSDKMNKTITIAVERRVLHPRFRKYIRATTTYKAHDEADEARIGDKVRIVETRPLSKTKRWRLVEIVERADEPVPVNVGAPPAAEPAAPAAVEEAAPPAPSEADVPAPSEAEGAEAEGPAAGQADEPAAISEEGPAPSEAEGPAPSEAEGDE